MLRYALPYNFLKSNARQLIFNYAQSYKDFNFIFEHDWHHANDENIVHNGLLLLSGGFN